MIPHSLAPQLLRRAILDHTGEVHENVLVEIADGRFTRVQPNTDPAHVPPAVEIIDGLTIPGLANGHSHAFHRALRGRTQRERGTFWTWRDTMYDVAENLTPDTLRALATAVYAEMLAAGITTVGEFHYLHHQADGSPHSDPNAMSRALVDAATATGIRLTLLDTCYLSSGFGEDPSGTQRRFSDQSVDGWARRHRSLVDAFAGTPGVTIGSAIHSIRAVPESAISTIVSTNGSAPLHIHLSEQIAENDASLEHYGRTPTQVFADNGALTANTTLVHATHLTDTDISLIGGAGAYVCFCCTTERDLADGIGPSRRLADAGARLTIGTDSQAVIDPFEEMRAIELDERLRSMRRGTWPAADLLAAGLRHDSLGVTDSGHIAAGKQADLVTIDTLTTRTAGTGNTVETAVFAASAADVIRTVVAGKVVHQHPDPRPGALLADAISALLP